MVEATVQMRDGTVKTAYARTFEGLFRKLNGLDFVKITGKTTSLKEMRQGKEAMQNGNHKGENRQP